MRFVIRTVAVIAMGLCGCAPNPAVEAEATAELVRMAQESIAEGASSSAQGESFEVSAPVGLLFTVEPKMVTPGSTATLSLRNGTPHQVGYNLCASELQHVSSGSWRTVAQESICTLELRLLRPSQAASYQRRLPANIAPGQYRFRTSVETPANPATPGLGWILSEPFTVDR